MRATGHTAAAIFIILVVVVIIGFRARRDREHHPDGDVDQDPVHRREPPANTRKLLRSPFVGLGPVG